MIEALVPLQAYLHLLFFQLIMLLRVSKAPEFPADINTSPSSCFNMFNPITIEESFFCFIAFVGVSSISIVSKAFFIVILLVISSKFLLYISFTLFFITSSFPIKIISDSISFAAFIAPLIFASGALSPPHTI